MTARTITGRYTPVMAGRRSGRSVVPINDVAAAVRRARAIDLRIQGHSSAEIARELSVTPATVDGYLADGLAMMPPTDAEEHRRLQLLRYDKMLAALWPQIEHGAPDAVRSAVLIEQERSKLIGTYATTKVDTTLTVQTEADRALAELLRDAEAQMKAREKQILDAEVISDGGA
jgi:DNA-binding CsgD family transcriptional regulator